MRAYARRRTKVWPFILAIVLVAVLVVVIISVSKKEPVDPHAGQVYIYDGFDWIWMTPLEGVEPNTITEEHFTDRGGRPTYIGSEFDVQLGIDVSQHQHEIDWAQVASSGIDYAYIRLGYRGYTEGGLFEDEYFEQNIKGALENGVEVGVYMFSQAINVQEAMEEARFVLERIEGYNVTLPIVFDWEKIPDQPARTEGLEGSVLTDCAVAFCETIKSRGYESAVYFNRNIGYYGFDLRRLTDYDFWFALPESKFPSFYYAVDMWQFSFTEQIPGIGTETDMNLRFIPKPTPTPDPAA